LAQDVTSENRLPFGKAADGLAEIDVVVVGHVWEKRFRNFLFVSQQSVAASTLTHVR